ncbi:tRNA (adenosine(37)-N6)-threonylcarbamoyltransferase complex transferase subunit TsaD [Helicobacter sp. MIT 11-5569]|uniref:tRNA (adenosine(37)-N6)-threonylcarbamoyltransferase complex transferase subunit TsaD n=1 Tax=Helicobacter sp. MIT 11-5569 TaxID=1548151 RepID=UPI00051F99CD|nr:tRNA (adenosine(37)-N6)-threonylcarbamoyltransferase complex transferase subunit TsaD [Helicobacter sp. MIT 11-5569]TLD84065.1 tRNA (adenosine(37)-N6)-threonylcarbamoyltransferase complex transferase subunit TsaD [Helicobacter sp. MIT 11-5569]
MNLILSIESSCDDSSIALTAIDTYDLIFHQKISQETKHSAFGGVVPELASRLHAESLPLILEKTKPYLNSLKAIAVTSEPGLNVTLLEGVMMAKTLSYALNLPLIGVNHLKGHLYSLFLKQKEIFPLGVLLVSGGHTMLLEAQSFDKISIKTQSLDDSFGESFDKVAKMLSLGYPGGPIVESFAKKGNARFTLPIPLRSKKQFAFSFSGLKNAVRLEIEEEIQRNATLNEVFKEDLCKSFQESAIAHLMQKCKIFFEENARNSKRWKHFGVVGGASANLVLRERILEMCNFYGVELLLAPLEFCADNAAMIGRVAVESYKRKEFSAIDFLQTRPRITMF